MLLSSAMITGFNTDVTQDGQVYHVQTEDRGRERPILESLVYIGGTIIAKKLTPYDEQLRQGATEEMIASLLKRQHQVICAAIKAGRIEDLIRHSSKGQNREGHDVSSEAGPSQIPNLKPEISDPPPPPSKQPDPPPVIKPDQSPTVPASVAAGKGGLNLDEVISDYLKRNSEQAKLDLKVVTPETFTAGERVSLRVQVSFMAKPEIDAIVTIKIIGTAFKPQVFIGRAGRDGIATFNFVLPAFTAGTAAIVIEGQSSHGRGELKHLIRRS